MWTLILTLVCIPSLVLGTLIETDRFAEIVPLADGATLVLIDLDNTLYESELMLGSAAWRPYFRKKMESLGVPLEDQKKLIDIYWDFLQQTVPVRAVDPEAPSIIERLREEGILVFGFTSRAKREMAQTSRQLESLGVHFTPFSAPLFDDPDTTSAFEGGVVYCGSSSKVDGLIALLNYLRNFDSCCVPETLLFMDDHEYHVLSLEHVATAFQLKYIGVRFSGADARSSDFNPAVVEYQWQHLPLLISDKEAASQLAP